MGVRWSRGVLGDVSVGGLACHRSTSWCLLSVEESTDQGPCVGLAVVGTRWRLPSFTYRDIPASGSFGAVRISHGIVTSGHA